MCLKLIGLQMLPTFRLRKKLHPSGSIFKIHFNNFFGKAKLLFLVDSEINSQEKTPMESNPQLIFLQWLYELNAP